MSLTSQIPAQYRRLIEHVKPYRWRLAGGVLFGILYGPCNVAVLSVVKKVWAHFFEEAQQWTVWQAVGAAALLPAAMAVRGLCDFLGAYLMNWVGLRSVMDLRVRMFEHLQRLSLDFYTGSRAGELMSRVTSDPQAVQQGIANVVEDIVKEPVTLVSVLAWLLYTDWKLTMTGLVLFPICLVPIVVYGRTTRKASRSAQENQADLLSVLQEAIAGLRVVRAFGMEQRETEEFDKIGRRVFRQRMRVVRGRAISPPLIELVAGLGGAMVFLYAYHVGLEGSKLIAFALGLFMLYAPIKKLSRVHLQIQETMAAADRIFHLLDQQPSVVEAAAPKQLPRLNRVIHFDHVSFRYGEDVAVVDDVDLQIPAGSLVAIVGASGAGKTTLFNLVPRFYDPTVGAVRIDGVDIRGVTFKSLRGQIGLVAQENFLFNDTVANNIAYGKPGAARDEIIVAAQRAHAHDFISQMPQQYDTMTGDLGVKLSGGQRQRLAIARAILKNPPILLLDEATSALDTESERAVQAALDDLMWGSGKRAMTMLVIAHRLSTVQHADRIVVLDKGRIVEQGTHEQLLARDQTYKRLYDLQFPGMIGWLLRILVSLIGSSLRWRVVDPDGILRHLPERVVIFAFWHNRIFLLPFLFKKHWSSRRRDKVVVLVSASKDGEKLAHVLERFDLICVRGSSSRRGSEALREMAHLMAEGYDTSITPDGPRGPKYRVAPGVVSLAQLAGVPIVPVSYDLGWKITLKSWDAFMIPLPFARATVRLSAPIVVPRDADEQQREDKRLELENVLKSLSEL